MSLTLRVVAVLLLLTPFSFARAAQDADAPASKKPAAKSAATRKPAAKAASAKKTKRKVSPVKIKQMQRAFVASSELRPMALQLMQHRSPAAYAGVEEYARRHAGTDAGTLAWLSLGYARYQDQQYPQSIAALEKARPRAGELGDYVRYLLAECYAAQNNSAKVIEQLHNFEEASPESIFLNDVVALYGAALDGAGRSQEAVNYLEAHRAPTRASVELALGKSYLHTANAAKGAEILRHLYFTMAASDQAVEAASVLRAQGSSLEGNYGEERTRAEILLKANRAAEAIKAYRALEERAPLNEIGNVQVALGAALKHTSAGDSRKLLERAQATGEANAQRLYLLGEFARGDNNEGAVLANLDAMRQQCGSSPWFEQALVSAANMYLLQKSYERAMLLFREAQQRFPAAEKASLYHWKAAWLTYRLGRFDQAKRDFEEQVSWYSSKPEVPAALYWRARVAEDEQDYRLSRAWYTKLNERFRNFYYGLQARERLARLPVTTEPVAMHADPVLAMIPEAKLPGAEAFQVEPPENQLRSEKAKLLVNAGLNDFAVRELEAERGGQGPRWSTLQIARIYEQGGDHHKAMRFLKKALPSYYALDTAALPRAYWEILFPRPYWADLQRHAQANALDPYLVASLIRQESEFDPTVISHANAIGLMQLLPSVGKSEAKALHAKHFAVTSLVEPEVNIELGTHYFHAMVSQYNGQVEYALAAYNAGSNRVDEWRAAGNFRDVPEFVESIPFTETREYVQAILRNAQVYQRLYPH